MENPEVPQQSKPKQVSIMVILLVLALVALGVDTGVRVWQGRVSAKSTAGATAAAGCPMSGGEMAGMGMPGAGAGMAAKPGGGGCPMTPDGKMAAGEGHGCGEGDGCGMEAAAPGAGGGCDHDKKPATAGADKPAAKTSATATKKPAAVKPAAKPATTTTKKPAVTKPVAAKKPAEAPKVQAATYICTMCPEVKSTKPGSCPKCGMDLTKK